MAEDTPEKLPSAFHALLGGRQGKFDDPGFFPVKINVGKQMWPLIEGHTELGCGDLEKWTYTCPECLRLELAKEFPDEQLGGKE
jgi:hypothetical protein